VIQSTARNHKGRLTHDLVAGAAWSVAYSAEGILADQVSGALTDPTVLRKIGIRYEPGRPVGKRRDRIVRLTAMPDSGDKPAAQLVGSMEEESEIRYGE
jgi:hypothetical protein